MRRQIEVTIPIQVEASFTFYVDDPSEVTPELIQEKLNAAQIEKDRESNATGLYYVILEPFGEPMFYDPNEEMESVR